MCVDKYTYASLSVADNEGVSVSKVLRIKQTYGEEGLWPETCNYPRVH